MVLFLKCYLAATNGLYEFVLSRRLAASFQAVSGVLLGGFIYLWIIMRSKIFSEEDLTYLPFGSKLALFLKQRDRSR
jgi:hypothetical protein